MRRIAIAGLSLLAAVILSAAPAAAADVKYEETFLKTEPLEADGKVYLDNISGDVHIRTWNRNEVKVEAVKTSLASSMEKAKHDAEMLKIEVRREECCLKIETKYPEKRTALKRFRVSVDYILTIPVKAGVVVNNVSGNIYAEAMAGLAKLTTVSGNIQVQNMKDGGVFTTVSGGIKLAEIAGDVEASTVSGSTSLCCVTGSVESETVSGNVTATRLSNARSVRVSVHSGSINFEGGLNPGSRYTFETHSGPVTVTLPADAAFDFECESFSGGIDSDFKASSETSGGSREHNMTFRAIHGTANGGGADVTISTFSGPIELKRAHREEKKK